jgi:ABC-type multidrug transport system ATPase subunit
VLVLGGPRALFEAAAGLRGAEGGTVHVEGQPALDAIREGVVASAPLDPPLPPRWTPGQYARWSARLAGHASAVAKSMAAEALARLDLNPFRDTRFSRAALTVRRAAVLAAALATGATTLLIEDPLTDLAPEIRRSFARAVVRAVGGRRIAFFAARMALESPAGLAADEAIVIDRSQVAHQGAPAQLAASERALVLRVEGDAAAFATAICAAGATLLAPADPSAPATLRIDAGPLATRDVLRIALECHAVVLEVHPIARAFA